MDFANLIKTAVIFALSAFILSFLFGLIAGVSMGHVILRSVLFMIIFGGMGAGIFVVYDRFLRVDSYDEAGADMDDSSRIGGQVNLTSDDGDDLSAGEVYSGNENGSGGEEGELLEVVGSDINLEAVGNYNESMSDLDELADNFAAMGDGPEGDLAGDDFSVNGAELGERTEGSGMGGGSSISSYSADVSLEDIGGPDSTPQDYAKVVRTMLKKDE